MNKDFCEREREREFFKSPALSYIYIYTTRPKRKKNSERTRDYSCPDLSTVHYLSSRRLAGWDLCSETQTLFHLPAGRHLILCDVGITPIVFFLSFFQTHTQKRCIMKMISFSPYQTDRCGITQLLSCWTKRKSRPAQVVSRRWPKKKKKLSEDRTRFVIGRKRQCRSVFSLISSSFFSQQLYYGSVINLFALNGQMNNERPPPSLFSSYLVFFTRKV